MNFLLWFHQRELRGWFSKTLKTEELAETQKFYDGELCLRRHEFQYVFVLNWNKKWHFKIFHSKENENFKFRKMGKHCLSFPKWKRCHNFWFLALPCFLGALREAPNLLEAAWEAPWSVPRVAQVGAMVALRLQNEWQGIRKPWICQLWFEGFQGRSWFALAVIVARLLSSAGSGKVDLQAKWKETQLCFQQEYACPGKISHPFCEIFMSHYSP